MFCPYKCVIHYCKGTRLGNVFFFCVHNVQTLLIKVSIFSFSLLILFILSFICCSLNIITKPLNPGILLIMIFTLSRHPDIHPDTHLPTVVGTRHQAVPKVARPQEPLRVPVCGSPHRVTPQLELPHLVETPLDMPLPDMEGPLPACARTAGTRHQRQREVFYFLSILFYNF